MDTQNLTDEQKKEIDKKTEKIKTVLQIIANSLTSIAIARTVDLNTDPEIYVRNQVEALIQTITNTHTCVYTLMAAITDQEIKKFQEKEEPKKENKVKRNDSKTSEAQNC